MKLRYLIPSFVAALTMFVSCSDDNEPTYLDEVQVSSSYVAIPQDGGSTSIDVTAAADWSIATDDIPEWLTISPASGSAGQSKITFSADATLDGRSCELLLTCAGVTQRINVLQGLSTVSNATCAEVIAGPDSKTYRVTGVCTKIANTTYGNWYLQDETGDIYIYGTLDKNGQEKNFLSLGLEVGDEITVEGPKTTYNGTVELVNVTVININKSLIKVDSLSSAEALPVEGGDVTAFVTCKGNGINVAIPEDAQDWLFIKSISGNEVTFHALPNEGGDRETTVTFTTTDGSKNYSSEVVISQKGAIVAATVEEFLAAEVGNTQYRLTGVITSVAKATYGNIYIADYTGECYVYGVGSKGDFEALGLKEGDVVTLVGKRGEYKGAAQMTGAQYESHISVTDVTIAEFLEKEDSKDVYYRVSGTIDEIANETYGNVYLTDGTNRLYVYGTYPGWGATGDARKNCLADKGIVVGDQLTVIGVKSTYKGTPQVANGIYFSHTSANE
ncbi:MAG: DNA-binding protein [Prevotella sp.]|nr:DNA-binding protein [Prevotella sp.]